ncbi:MAG: hypothetical protein Q4P17_05135 [Methanobacterium sp.]|nr:hypothetical protein [Methanobacterium sp.]
MAKKTGKNHELVVKLWEAGYRETRILSCMIDIPNKSHHHRWINGLLNLINGKSVTSVA